MKKKLTILAFGLLLAVGWTNDASAQKLPQGKPWYQSAFFQKMTQPTTVNSEATAVEFSANAKVADAEGANGKMSKAPMRANYTQTAPATHVKSWYDGKHYTWYDGNGNAQTASYTDVVADTCQMFWFIRSLYIDETMPGIKYTEAQNYDLAYEGCDFGYWISGDITQDITISMTSNCYITYIQVIDYAGNPIITYDVDDGSTPPTGMTMPYQSYMTRTQDSNGWYYWKFTNNSYTDFYPAFTISKNLLTGKGGVYVYVNARNTYSTANRTYSYKVSWYDYNFQADYSGNAEAHLLNSTWGGQESMVHGPITPPTENGYSVVLVKLQDDFGAQPEEFTYTDSALYSYYHKYVKELQLLTDGLRVNENTTNAGTLFAYTGDLSKFYFISKGKLYPISGSENAWVDDDGDYVRYADRAPFYNMYEEFSPFVDSGTEDHSDFYEKLKQGVTYPVLHDCMSVAFMRHYFAMTGESGATTNRVNSLVLYIPDQRGQSNSRTYEEAHQPSVGMYMIDLYADIEPSTTPDMYTVTVNWYDNLDAITHSDGIPQTYYLYQIMYNEQTGQNDTICVTPNGTNQTTWSQDYPVGDPSAYDISYYVIGVPTNATNKDVFFAKSNTDDVTVPGKTDFVGLQWWRYESDYVTDDGTNQEVNYYRNFLAPHALAVQGEAGINAGNVGTTGRTLTLYRDDTPIIDLELVMNGNKAYYRIKYRNRSENQQVEPGYDPNTGELLNTNN